MSSNYMQLNMLNPGGTLINFDPNMEKYLHPLLSVEWNYLSITKLQRYSRWSLGMDK